jgi:hypothetical protein
LEPAPHGRGWDLDLLGDLAVAVPVDRREQGGTDGLDGVRPSWVSTGGEQDMGSTTGPATGPAGGVGLGAAPTEAQPSGAGVTPGSEYADAAVLGAHQLAGDELDSSSGGVEEQQHRGAPDQPRRSGPARGGRVRVAA